MYVSLSGLVPGELVTLPLGLGEDEDLGAVLAADLLQQPSQLLLLLVLVAHIHDLGAGGQSKVYLTSQF